MKQPWTAERVITGLTKAFRECPSRPIYGAPRESLVRAVAGEGGAGDAIAWNYLTLAYLCLGCDRTPRDRRDRLMLFTYAAARAGGESLAARSRALGWDPETVSRRAREAAARTAAVMEVALRIHQAATQART